VDVETKKRKSGIPTGNAGEYFVMGELLRRGLDAQLADRNTKGYDVLACRSGEATMRKIQVKTVRAHPWYVKLKDFDGDVLDQITVYVLLGDEDAKKLVRYFIVKNRELVKDLHRPKTFRTAGFMSMKAVEKYEDRWHDLLT
jgi:hypothetical protein